VLGERIGTGGLGEVHAAHDPQLDRRVAIKIVRARGMSAAATEQLRIRMEREARALAKLSHPNVVAVHDSGVVDGGVFVAMELVEGSTLAEWIAHGERRPAEILAVLVQAGRGLAAAHRAGIVHRDFKPTNVLVSESPSGVDGEARARVADFGLARAAEPDDPSTAAAGDVLHLELTATGAWLGTPAYMAPEQFLAAAVDARTDQFGFCVTALEALTGTRPFAGDDVIALRSNVVAGRRRALARPSGVDVRAWRALERGCAVDPADRFPAMSELLAELEPRAASRRLPLVVASLGGAAIVALLARSSAGDAPPSGAIRVEELRAQWATPNQVRWAWHAEGDPDALRTYELVTGPSEADVLAASPSTTRWTAATRPELGRFLLPRTGNAEPVRSTTTSEHPEDTAVFAQLVAIDTAGRRSTSNVASIVTSEAPVGEIVVFADDETAGFGMPDGFAPARERPFAGTGHLQWRAECPASPCWVNLRRQALGISLDAITAGTYSTTAFLELAIAAESSGPTWYSQVRVWYDPRSLANVAHYEGITLASDGEYRVLQVPLRAFARDGVPVPADELQFGLFEVGVGGSWADGAVVRVDEIRVRW
jgi:tRNA A-37 threonylcarbamoyl transferase component Bud32